MSDSSKNLALAPKPVWLKTVQPFLFGGTAGMLATTIIQPIDMVKVRIQLLEGKATTKNPLKLAGTVIKQDGVLGLYKGLSAALLRQATYTTARMGIYSKVEGLLKGGSTEALPFWKKAVAGLTAGGLGSIIGTPADVALVRMQADNTLPEAERRGYKNAGDALIKIWRQEGVGGMFKGVSPVVYRAMALNVGMLSTYSQSLDVIGKYSDDQFVVRTGAKALSGFFASAFSLPFDFLKTRLQTAGAGKYNGLLDCAIKVAKQEGVMAYYKGFWTFYIRIAPHAMLCLYFVETFNDYVNARYEK
eukprot:TRINITY_DN66017_c0_g1_i1.p1 TRINITY_DN66017_c0_g1~~TRINITY_DN66017_c0_g1_i1.p1  ORF type:complete len:347 (+),score=167.23 TRINITY_DN66017_c0_g1_i1:134-1042(+)